jgi:hypothetical protein
MLAVLRFSFSKELKFVRARLGKPYNSALGMYRNRRGCYACSSERLRLTNRGALPLFMALATIAG